MRPPINYQHDHYHPDYASPVYLSAPRTMDGVAVKTFGRPIVIALTHQASHIPTGRWYCISATNDSLKNQ
jgi:hypothetical protein